MTGESEAAGDALTGGIIAGTVEGPTRGSAREEHAPQTRNCLNCGASLSGAYCSACGQPAHLHRSLLSLWHDILHGVFHFEGKIWRTLPELFFHPGRLTRRYIDGERVKFVSPMALFLFTVFLMFAVFSVTGVFDAQGLDPDDLPAVASNWKEGNEAALKKTNEQIAALRVELADPSLTPERREQITKDMTDLESAGAVMDALARGDWKAVAEIDERQDKAAIKIEAAQDGATDSQWPPPGSKLDLAIKQARDNPMLLMYKVKTNAYKFSWALIPLSVPFLWLLFFWRRDIHLYDHAIFTTYSISFMMLLTILLSVAASAGVSAAIWGSALAIVPPIHIYKQLRGTYGLSRFGALARLIILLIVISVVISIFTTLLFVLGAI